MFTEKQLRRQPSETQTELMNRMLGEAGSNKYRAVSFRMEDVLVMTPFLDEYALFMFMEEDFAMFDTKGKKTFTELRIAAAEAAEKKYGVRTRVTLAKIYDIFAKLSGVSPDGRDKLMERECELIEHFTFPRECGKALYREAKNSRKRVIIWSMNRRVPGNGASPRPQGTKAPKGRVRNGEKDVRQVQGIPEV